MSPRFYLLDKRAQLQSKNIINKINRVIKITYNIFNLLIMSVPRSRHICVWDLYLDK